jgi:hypothetical protein
VAALAAATSVEMGGMGMGRVLLGAVGVEGWRVWHRSVRGSAVRRGKGAHVGQGL